MSTPDDDDGDYNDGDDDYYNDGDDDYNDGDDDDDHNVDEDNYCNDDDNDDYNDGDDDDGYPANSHPPYSHQVGTCCDDWGGNVSPSYSRARYNLHHQGHRFRHPCMLCERRPIMKIIVIIMIS